ncbi:hypothetical protein ACH4WW_28735 [Streptomyces halstedii]|uniref:hypothetical protein n=1 Tax=Streptomyces halstedii TaxID=1944 RepID=UPI0037A57502
MTPSEADAAAVGSWPEPLAHETALHELQEFRVDLRSCLPWWGDALFEIADAVLCGEGPVRNLAELSLVPGYARSHGSIQRAMNNGRIDMSA